MRDPSNLRRAKFIYRFSAVGGSALAIFGALHAFLGSRGKGAFELALATVVVLNVLWFRRGHNHVLAITVSMLVLFAAMPFLIITGGLDNTGIVWVFLFPSVAFFLTGKKGGAYVTGVFFAVLIAMLGAQAFGALTTAYTLAFFRQVLAALMALTLILYFYESISDEDQRFIADRVAELEKANKRLAAEAKARAVAAEQLNRKAADLEKLNQLMVGREIKMSELKKQLAQREAAHEPKA